MVNTQKTKLAITIRSEIKAKVLLLIKLSVFLGSMVILQLKSLSVPMEESLAGMESLDVNVLSEVNITHQTTVDFVLQMVSFIIILLMGLLMHTVHLWL